MSRILFVTSEAYPLIKTGGLADVCGALPLALKKLRHDIRLMLPAYNPVLAQLKAPKVLAKIYIPGLPGTVDLLGDNLPGSDLPVILVDYAAAYRRDGNPYVDNDGHSWTDNGERFALFARAICRVALNNAHLDWQPDVVHCNDWQTGLVPALLKLAPKAPLSLFTIHNLAYQGLFPYGTFLALGLPHTLWAPNALEFHKQLSFIKGGLVYADKVTTVSQQYAREIQTPEFGCGLEGLLQYRSNDLQGIVNGIDEQIWNPAQDALIAQTYDTDSLDKKLVNKSALQQRMGLPDDKDAFLLGFVGRLVEQKGIDLIIEAIGQFSDAPVQLAVLGSGDKRFEKALQELAGARAAGKVRVELGYNESLAHLIEAGADAFLMPSRFEPCGLNQLYSLRYGTIPIVHHVGGLADTVIDANEHNLKLHRATGVVFNTPTAHALAGAIDRAFRLYKSPTNWKQLQHHTMQQSFSWSNSTEQYTKIYHSMLTQSPAREPAST